MGLLRKERGCREKREQKREGACGGKEVEKGGKGACLEKEGTSLFSRATPRMAGKEASGRKMALGLGDELSWT